MPISSNGNTPYEIGFLLKRYLFEWIRGPGGILALKRRNGASHETDIYNLYKRPARNRHELGSGGNYRRIDHPPFALRLVQYKSFLGSLRPNFRDSGCGRKPGCRLDFEGTILEDRR
ncbi:hypothetical protein D3C76_1287400 [compost metagenome]